MRRLRPPTKIAAVEKSPPATFLSAGSLFRPQEFHVNTSTGSAINRHQLMVNVVFGQQHGCHRVRCSIGFNAIQPLRHIFQQAPQALEVHLPAPSSQNQRSCRYPGTPLRRKAAAHRRIAECCILKVKYGRKSW